MHDARDAEDRRLLEARDHAQLLANYVHQIRERCAVRIRDPYAADDVAQAIALRLWRELEEGRHRGPVPFRVVVWHVTSWTIGGHFARGPVEVVALAEHEAVGADELEELAARYDLRRHAESLPGRQRQMFELVYLQEMTSGEAAVALGIEANAAYQALHNAHRALSGRLGVD